jgi:hypothetical protein
MPRRMATRIVFSPNGERNNGDNFFLGREVLYRKGASVAVDFENRRISLRRDDVGG